MEIDDTISMDDKQESYNDTEEKESLEDSDDDDDSFIAYLERFSLRSDKDENCVARKIDAENGRMVERNENWHLERLREQSPFEVSNVLGDIAIENEEDLPEEVVDEESCSFERWRSGVLAELAELHQQPKSEGAAVTNQGTGREPTKRVEFAEVARHFSFPGREVSEDEVKFPVQSLVPEGRQQEFLRKLLQVPYSFQNKESTNTNDQDMRRDKRRSHRGADFEQIAMEEFPVFNAPAITKAPTPRAEQEPFRGPNGKFTWPIESMFRPGSEQKWRKMVQELQEEQRRYYARPGGRTRRRIRELQVFEEKEHFVESVHAPRITDCSDPTACRAAEIGDRKVGRIDVEALRKRLPGWCQDEACLYYLDYGWPEKGNLARGWGVANVLESATPFMQQLNETIEKEVEVDGTLYATNGYFPKTYPAIMSATGAVSKKWKPAHKIRITWAADPRTIPEIDSEGRPWSVNAGVDGISPRMIWPKASQYCVAGRILFSMSHVVEEREPAVSDILTPESVSIDYRGFYRQLFMQRGAEAQQSFFFATPAGNPRFLSSPAMLFGGNRYPNDAMRVASVLVAAVVHNLENFEYTIRAAAAQGNITAAKHCPHTLIAILEARRRRLGIRQALPFVVGQFIDDKLALTLGIVRLIACLCIIWLIAEESNFQIAEEKVRAGQSSVELGQEFNWAEARVRQPRDKQLITTRWLQRIKQLKSITHKEFESAIGTIQFAVFGLEGGRSLLARSFRALHAKRMWRGKSGRMKIRSWLIKDLEKLQRLAEEAAQTGGGRSFFEVAAVERPLRGCVISATDACRCVEGYSGGAGVVVSTTGRALIFSMQFDKAMARIVPIHILEFLMALVAIQLIAIVAPQSKVAEFQDNQAVVWACQLLKSSDPRMQECILLREAILIKSLLDSRVSYIKSKDNEVADEGSRGRVQKMKEHAVSKGWRIEQELSLRDISSIIPDLPQLFARIIHMTNLMSDPNKSTDLDP